MCNRNTNFQNVNKQKIPIDEKFYGEQFQNLFKTINYNKDYVIDKTKPLLSVNCNTNIT